MSIQDNGEYKPAKGPAKLFTPDDALRLGNLAFEINAINKSGLPGGLRDWHIREAMLGTIRGDGRLSDPAELTAYALSMGAHRSINDIAKMNEHISGDRLVDIEPRQKVKLMALGNTAIEKYSKGQDKDSVSLELHRMVVSEVTYLERHEKITKTPDSAFRVALLGFGTGATLVEVADFDYDEKFQEALLTHTSASMI